MAYKIVRSYYNKPGKGRAITRGLTLEEAQAHCRNPETSRSTCTDETANVRRTHDIGPWFDGYEEE